MGAVFPQERGLRVWALGEMLIDFTARESGVDVGTARSFEKNPGGAPANVAVAVVRLGGRAGFVGCVGDDAFGRHLLGVLRKEEVDVRFAQALPDAATSLAFVARRGGEPDYFFVRNPGADTLLTPAMVDAVDLRRQDIVHLGSNSLAAEPIRSAVERMLVRVKEAGAALCFDVNLRPAFWENAEDREGVQGREGREGRESARSLCLHFARQADVLKVNRDELAWLTGADSVEDGLVEIARLNDGVICCTLGADGVALIAPTYDGGQEVGLEGDWESGRKGDRKNGRVRVLLRVPGFRVQPVDATGAGDALIGALLFAIASGEKGIWNGESGIRFVKNGPSGESGSSGESRSIGKSGPFEESRPPGGVDTGEGYVRADARRPFVDEGGWKERLAHISEEQWRIFAQFACAAAACNIRERGAIGAMPTRGAVLQLLAASSDK